MSTENQNSLPTTHNSGSETLKKRKKIAVKYIGGAAAVLALGTACSPLGSPEMTGNQTVTVNPGDTLDDLINEHVDGGASHTGEVRVEVKNDPDNADVFENGQLDPGEELELPEKVQ